MSQQARTLIVFFNLKTDVKEADYLKWAIDVDLATVNKLNSVSSIEVLKGMNMLGEQTASPWDFFEVIEISSEAAFLEDIQTDRMSKVIEQFQQFAKDVHFISTIDITSL